MGTFEFLFLTVSFILSVIALAESYSKRQYFINQRLDRIENLLTDFLDKFDEMKTWWAKRRE